MRRIVAATLGTLFLTGPALAGVPAAPVSNQAAMVCALKVFRVFGDDDVTGDGSDVVRRPARKSRTKVRKQSRLRKPRLAPAEASPEPATGILELLDPCSPVQ